MPAYKNSPAFRQDLESMGSFYAAAGATVQHVVELGCHMTQCCSATRAIRGDIAVMMAVRVFSLFSILKEVRL